jgi:hypothetical protein
MTTKTNGRAGKLVVSATALILASCASLERPAPDAEGTLIRNVTLIPMDRAGSVARQDVLVRGGRIVSIGRSGSIRTGQAVKRIDGRGKYLMPGLWDMHVHAMTGRSDPARETLPLYVSYGIVGLRDLGSTLEELASLRQEMASDLDLPELIASGPPLDGPKQPWQQKMALPLGTVEEAAAAAEKLADAGVDFLKIYNNLSPQLFVAVAEVARKRQLPFAGHVPFGMTLEQVSAAGQKSIEHGGLQLVKDCIPDGQKATPAMLNAWIKNGFPGRYEESSRWWAKRDEASCRELYRRMAERGTWVTPTLVNDIKGGRWTRQEDLVGIPDYLRKACETSLKSINSAPALRDAADRDLFNLVAELHRQGVSLLAGSDVPNECLWHGSSLHKELQMLVHAGLSNWEALKTATVNPARFLGRTDSGIIRKGAVANLLLLDGDPLSDMANTLKIRGVMLKGRWHDAAALRQMRKP